MTYLTARARFDPLVKVRSSIEEVEVGTEANIPRNGYKMVRKYTKTSIQHDATVNNRDMITKPSSNFQTTFRGCACDGFKSFQNITYFDANKVAGLRGYKSSTWHDDAVNVLARSFFLEEQFKRYWRKLFVKVMSGMLLVNSLYHKNANCERQWLHAN